MKQTKHFMRAFALLIALSVLPLLLTSNNIRGADDTRSGSLYADMFDRVIDYGTDVRAYQGTIENLFFIF